MATRSVNSVGPKSVRIKLHKQKGGGYGDVKFTPEEKARVKSETMTNIVSGNAKRDKYKGYDLTGDELQQVIQNEDKPGGNGSNTLLLSKINKLSEIKKFKTIENKDRLKAMLEKIPDLDEYPVKVLRMVIDNKQAKLGDEDSDDFYNLSDIILADPSLKSLFRPNDLVMSYNDPSIIEDALGDIRAGTKQFKANSDRVTANEKEQFMKLLDMTEKGSVEPMSEIKKILPVIDKLYNKRNGNKPNQNIPKLGRDKINEIFPFAERATALKSAQEDYEVSQRLAKDKSDRLEIVERDINTLTGHILSDEKIIKHSIVERDKLLTGSGGSIKNLKVMIEKAEKSYREALAHGSPAKHSKKLAAQLSKRLANAEVFEFRITQLPKSIEENKAQLETLENERDHLIAELNTLADMTKSAQDKYFEIKTDQEGDGLVAPHGRFKNGNIRKRKPRKYGVYEPKNKLHWIQKRAPNPVGRMTFSGGVLSLSEIIEKLLQVRDSNQQNKAISMLESLEDTIPKKEYDRIYKLITD